MKASELTTEEIRWTVAIKSAALADPATAHIASDMTDFEFVQHAIVAKDQVDKALERILEFLECQLLQWPDKVGEQIRLEDFSKDDLQFLESGAFQYKVAVSIGSKQQTA